MLPAASIVIPALNEEEYLPRLLKSLTTISSPLEIIVVDGASTDRTCEVVEKLKPLFTGNASLTLLRSQKRGISLQRNMGAERATHNILIFCDADVIFSAGLYEKMLAEFSTKGYVVASPLLRPIEPGIRRSATYQFLRLMQRIVIFSGRAYFPGACLITLKSVFTKAGGFDVNIVLAEDVDYSLRASAQGTFGLLTQRILVSDRRFIKYGYGWILSEIPNVLRLAFTGTLRPETIFYPFGEYGGQEAHHVTGNRG